MYKQFTEENKCAPHLMKEERCLISLEVMIGIL